MNLLIPLVFIATVGGAASFSWAQDALGDGHALDGNLSTSGSRNDAVGSVRPGQQDLGGLTNPNLRLNLTTNADFRAQDMATPSAFMYSGGLYNNPWYWAHAGSLEGELMANSGGLEGQGSYGGVWFSDGTGMNPDNPFWQNNVTDSSSRVNFGGELSAISQLNRMTPDYIAPGQPGNVLQSAGESTPDDFRTPWEYTIGGQSPFLRDVHRNSLMRDNLRNRELSSEPHVVGSGISSDQQMIRYTASNLRGLGMVFPGANPGDFGLTQYDLYRSQQDTEAGRNAIMPGEVYETRITPTMLEDRRLSSRMTPPSPGGQAPQVEAVMAEMAQRYRELNPSAADDVTNRFQQDYRQIQQNMARFQIQPRLDQLARLSASTGTGVVDPDDPEELPGPRDLLPQNPGGEPGEPTEETDDELPSETGEVAPPRMLDPADVGLVLRHGQRIASFSSGDGSRFDELMKGGQRRLNNGEYFWAEKRFDRALRFTPGHPLASAGLAHSQIGAGLHLTAALTLKTLMGFQPEMIDVRYAPELLPLAADLDREIRQLQAQLADPTSANRSELGFLLAYLGHQTDRAELIREGLDAMTAANADPVFTDILRRVWLPSEDIELPAIQLPAAAVTPDTVVEDVIEDPVGEEAVPVQLEPLLDPED